MEGSPFVYGLQIGLAIALIWALIADWRHRTISNRLNAAIALGAPVYWWANGYSLWPGIGLQIVIAIAVLLFFTLFFALGQMGGGDVKLLTAVALWLPWQETYSLVLLSSILGLGVTAVFWALHRRSGASAKVEIPFGIAIALAGLWVIGERYFNHFA